MDSDEEKIGGMIEEREIRFKTIGDTTMELEGLVEEIDKPVTCKLCVSLLKEPKDFPNKTSTLT
jgi:hypothetical protein